MECKMLILGLAVGMIGGALIAANSAKARQLVKDGQEQMLQKAKELSDCNCKRKKDEE